MGQVAHKLKAADAEIVAQLILSRITAANQSEKIMALAQALHGMADKLSQRIIQKSYELVLRKMHDAPFRLPIDQSLLVASLAVLPGTTPEGIANDAIQQLLDVLKANQNSEVVRYVVDRLGTVGGNLSKDAGHKAVTQILATMNKTTETVLWRELAMGLASVSLQLDRAGKFTPADAPEVLKNLAWSMDVTSDPVSLRQMSEATAAIASRLPAKGADEAAKIAIEQILDSIQTTHDPQAIGLLARCWEALSARMSKQQIDQAFVQILVANENRANVAAMPALCEAAVALAMATESRDAADALGYLLQALHSDHHPAVLQVVLDGIVKLTPRVPMSDVPAARDSIIAVTGIQDRINDQIMTGLIKALDGLPDDIDNEILVELLKSPFCTGEARRTLLVVIERQTRQNFEGNPWNLVAKAKSIGIETQVLSQAVHRPQSAGRLTVQHALRH